MRKVFMLLLCCGYALTGFAQNTMIIPSDNMIIKDPRVDSMIRKQIYINSLALHNKSGYRVQVISTQDRAKAMSIKSQLLQQYPQYRTYLSYQSPYFRVRIGDFKTRDEAAILQEELTQAFQSGVFTVRDVININPEQDLFSNDDPAN